VLILGILLSLPVAARGPDLSAVPQPGGSLDREVPIWDGSLAGCPPSSAHAELAGLGPEEELGEPGLSFRYEQTFGTTEAAYIEDSTHFYNVAGLACDGTNVWIADLWGIRALKFDSSGSYLQQIGAAGFRYGSGASLDLVNDVGVDNEGNVWLVDADVSYVVKFDSDGNYLMELGQAWSSGSGNDQFNSPLSIAFDGDGTIYVSDSGVWGDYGNHRVQVFDASGAYLATIGETGVPGSDNNHLNSPRHIAVYGAFLYVADAGNHRVQIFDISAPASPAYVATVGVSGEPGSDDGHFDWPEGAGVDASHLYVADGNNNRVQIFDRSSLAYVATIGTGYGQGNYQFNHPSDVVADSAGRIYVADNYNKRVQQYDGSGTYLRTYGTTDVPYVTDGYHYYSPAGVAVDADGSIYVLENRGHRLVKLDAGGEVLWTFGQPGQNGGDNDHFFFPGGVALDGAGRLYVADSVSNRVQILNGDGTYHATLGTGEGQGQYELSNPNGVAVSLAGGIYVADLNNHRIQVFDEDLAYAGTIGVTGEAGSDNDHFDAPQDVAVDGAGNVFVADLNNHRTQKCVPGGSTWTCDTIAGESGVPGGDLGHLEYPTAVAVDGAGRIYVADGWGDRIQVFDGTGAYLSTVGNSSGSRTGQVYQVEGLAVDRRGHLYIADLLAHHVRKFATGVPGWRQSNLNGFGDLSNRLITSLAAFGPELFAGTNSWSGNGAQLWRWSPGGDWEPAVTDGFGNAENEAIDHLWEYEGQLYAGTWSTDTNGGEVWRSGNGTAWEQVVGQGFGDPTNVEVFRFATFDGSLYATTWSGSSSHGGEVWRSASGDAGDWEQVVAGGFGDANNIGIVNLVPFGTYLYATTFNYISGTEVWRSPAGNLGTWVPVSDDGFGNAGASGASGLSVFGGHLYAVTGAAAGAQVWRCQACDGTDWEEIEAGGFGNASTQYMPGLEVFQESMYAVVGNVMTGMEVWRTADGLSWEQVGLAGFGDSNNRYPYWDNSVTVFNDGLYVGTVNYANGGEVWMYLPYSVHLPLVVRSR